MPKPTDFRVLAAETSLETIAYRTPMKFGGRVVTSATLLNVRLEIETRAGRIGTGTGSMPLGNAWAWPSRNLAGETTLAAMRSLGEKVACAAADREHYGDAIEIIERISSRYETLAAETAGELALGESMPPLAAYVAASPTDAAVHDAIGKTLGINSFLLLGSDFQNRDLGAYLGADFAGEYLDRYVSKRPQARMPLYHLVGALDPLFDRDVPERLHDGLPETLGEWIMTDGLTHLKIKLAGDDLAWDLERTSSVERAAAAAQASLGVSQWNYSLDFNEKCPHVEYLLEFFTKLEQESPAAWSRVQYVEQPTHRDLAAHPENLMHRAAAIKPVVIDESLLELESLLLAREQGYSGVALKACKGHTKALFMGAAAQKYGMFLCVQDLTCPGFSFLHSAALAARVSTVAAIEGNGRQYCPAGNAPWSDRFPEMFHITDGTVGTGVLTGPGLGF